MEDGAASQHSSAARSPRLRRNMEHEIANSELTLAEVPAAEADWETIQRFALTFDGYKASGSLDKCADIAMHDGTAH